HNHGAVVFHLPRDEDLPPLAPTFEDRRPAFVLADAGLNDESPELAGAIKDRLVEGTVLQQPLQLARPRWIEMDSQSIDRDRQRGDAVCTEPTRTKESVLDFEERNVPALELSD